MTRGRLARGNICDPNTHTYDPMSHLSNPSPFAGVRLAFADNLERFNVPGHREGEHLWGLTRWVPIRDGEEHRADIYLRRGLSTHQIRCTLTHEMLHVERGAVPESCRDAEEAIVELLTAARLIATSDLLRLGADVASQGVEGVARSLQVSASTVEAGMRLALLVDGGCNGPAVRR